MGSNLSKDSNECPKPETTTVQTSGGDESQAIPQLPKDSIKSQPRVQSKSIETNTCVSTNGCAFKPIPLSMVSNKAVQKRTRIMDDIVVIKVLKYIDVKQLLGLQRVSQQFMDCVQEVLSTRIKELKLRKCKCCQIFSAFPETRGTTDGEIGDVLDKSDVNSDDSKRRLDSLTKHFKNVSVLQIDVELKPQMFEVLVKNCQQIECLYFGKHFLSKTSINDLMKIGETFKPLKQRIKVLSFYFESPKSALMTNQMTSSLLKSFPRLEKLEITQKRRFHELMDSIPDTVTHLILFNCTFRYSKKEMLSFRRFLRRRRKPLELLITFFTFKRKDLLIMKRKCDLKTLTIGCQSSSTNDCIDFFESQRNLSILRVSRIYCHEVMDFEGRQWLPKIEMLDLMASCIKRPVMESFVQFFQNLSRLILFHVHFGCQCKDGSTESSKCYHCSSHCLQSLSAMKRLKHLEFTGIVGKIASFDSFLNLTSMKFCDQLLDIKSMVPNIKTHCVSHPNKEFIIDLSFKEEDIRVEDDLRQLLVANPPKNLEIIFY